MHIYLLGQIPDAPQRPAVAIALGMAGIVAALAGRTWPHAGTAFLLALGALGFLPNPLTWLPAGALMMGAGACGLVGLRHPPTRRVSETAPVSAAYAAPGSTPPHWSVAPQVKGAAPSPGRSAGTGGLQSSQHHRDAWGPKSKGLAAGLILAAAAVVVPFSWGQQGPVASAFMSPTTTSVLSSASTTSSTSPVLPSGPSAGYIMATREGAADTTTTLPVTFDRIGPVDPADPDAFVLFSDVRFGFTVALPSTWAEVPGSALADYDPATYHLATFADIDGPRHNDAFLNGITVEVLAGSQTEDPPQELVQQRLKQALDLGSVSHEYYSVLEPIHDVQVGGAAGLSATVRLTWNERVMVKTLYLCIANHCLYVIGLQTDDVDWNVYQDLFEQVLGSVSFTAY